MLWLGVVLLVATHHLLAHDAYPQRSTSPRFLLAIAAVLGLLGCLVAPGLYVLGAILAIVGVLSFGFGAIDEAAPKMGLAKRRRPEHESLLPVVLAVGPIGMLGIAVVQAASGQAALDGGVYWVFVAAGIVAPILLGLVIQLRLLRELLRPVVIVSAALVLILAAGLVVNPWRWGDLLGVFGTFACFAVILSLLGFAIAAADLRWRPPAVLLVLGQRRLPLLGILAVWAVGVALILPEPGYHDIRDEPLRAGTPPRVDVGGAWSEWLRRNRLPAPRAGERPRGVRVGVPLVVVAASGGGIRAAYWTARVVDCAIDQGAHKGCERGHDQARRVFLASGISGGSLGLASWAAHRVSGATDPGTRWVDERLGEDYFAPTWARTLFSDLPASLLRIGSPPDRGTVLERAWEQSWTPRQTDLRSLFEGPQPSTGPLTTPMLNLARVPDLPPLMFGGTSVTDGCRTSTSRLRGGASKQAAGCASRQSSAAGGRTFGATRDVFDACEGRDLRLSTAALLSARFPIISPAGRVACGRSDGPQVVDGGYFDNSAASPVQELWERLAPLVDAYNGRAKGHCVVPVLLQVDNAYVSTAPPSEASSRALFAPLTALIKTRSAREEGARQAAAIPFSSARLDDGSTVRGGAAPRTGVSRYVKIFPRVQPGAQAPLGWTLSEPSRDSLARAVEAGPNATALGQVRRWFRSSLRCVR